MENRAVSSVPQLNFLDYQLVSVGIQADGGFDPRRPERAQIEASFGVHRHTEDSRRFMVSLVARILRSAEVDDSPFNVPYAVQIGLSGEFLCAQDQTPEGIEARVVNNALSLLYGVGRGIVGQATGGGVNGRFVLPTINFDALVRKATLNPESQVRADSPVAARKKSTSIRKRSSKKAQR
jgi:hypothetical protein